MRYAILADIHANLAAFTAVLDDINRRGGADELWCLGDVVDYGPDTSECINLLRQQKHVCVAGNHDLAAIGRLELAGFNPDAAAACRWTRQHLTPEDIDYLGGLPPVLKRGDFTLVHASPRDPAWEYLLSEESATANFRHFDTPFCLIGHSHQPLAFREESGAGKYVPWPEDGRITLGEKRMILNPGSVGQPRDGDPRAAWLELDTEAWLVRFHRVEYDIDRAAGAITAAELPEHLARRLYIGQ
jgi:diadenosine tetraphosphatase ApaH/serine/threonine PP2A family protein phosphatase